jgi:N-acetylglucosamine-6-phosphate deacetylase
VERAGVNQLSSSASSNSAQVLRGVVVHGGGQIDDGVVAVTGDRITWVGPAHAWPGTLPPLPASRRSQHTASALSAHPPYLLPGLVDVHCHGGAGHGFPEADVAGLRAAIQHHRRHGTTSLLGSLVSAPPKVLEQRIRVLSPLVEAGELAGIHLEGPFLATAQCGAQDPRTIIPGDPKLLDRLIDLGQGGVSSMTLAPETPRYRELLRVMVRHGVLPSLGHTDATSAVTGAGIAAVGGGRLSATHLFNAMPTMHHRAPGPVAACLAAAARGEMILELVADGVHLADETTAMVFDLVGPGQIALTTDAMAAAGMPDGRYPLGSQQVDVVQGVARLATGLGDTPGFIAGGTARLIDVVRRVVRHAGVPLAAAVAAASGTPARLLGIDHEVGDLVVGRRADIVLTDAELTPLDVMRGGRWLVGGRDLAAV